MSIKIGNIDVSYFKVGSSDCKIYLGDTLLYPQSQPHDYSQDYLTYVALGDNFELGWTSNVPGNRLSYSTDNGSTWSEPSSNFVVTLANSGDTIMLKGSAMTTSLRYSIGDLKPTDFAVDYKVQGNIMSLLFGDNFVNQTDLTGYVSVFNSFFQGPNIVTPNARLLSVENLVLPATTLEQDCYHNMFLDCTSLTTAPHLPATTLAVDCYESMFQGCTSLRTAPELPATELTTRCYNSMFQRCTSLTTAPELPATTLADNCYRTMFSNCTNLTAAPELPATALTSNCYQNMFQGCTSLTTAPELPATTLANNCYRTMFSNCTNLNSITCLATDISASYCTSSWLKNVAASGTFTKAASMTNWTEGINGIPRGWTVQDYSS